MLTSYSIKMSILKRKNKSDLDHFRILGQRMLKISFISPEVVKGSIYNIRVVLNPAGRDGSQLKFQLFSPRKK